MHRMVIVSAAALAGAGVVLAQPLTGLVKWEASGDGGATWHSHLVQAAGAPYKIRATASWTDGPVASVGFAGASFRQIDLVGAVASDTFDIGSAVALKPTLFTQVWTVQPGSAASAGYLKIDRDDPAKVVDFGQLPKIVPGGVPNPDFDASNPILLLEMDAIASGGTPARMLTISGEWNRTGIPPPANIFKVFTTDTGLNEFPAREAEQEALTIEVIPAPGGVMVLGGVGLRWCRRVRRGA